MSAGIDSMLLSYQGESALYSLPECQGTLWFKQVPDLMFNSQERDSNPQPLST